MYTPKVEHLETLTRAQNHLEFDVDVTNNPRLKKLLRSDIKRLCEIREMLLLVIENPTLPFVESPREHFNPHLDALDAELEGKLSPLSDEPNASF